MKRSCVLIQWRLEKRDLRDDAFLRGWLAKGREEPQGALDIAEGKEAADAWGCPEVSRTKER